jgi:hypothetical protein
MTTDSSPRLKELLGLDEGGELLEQARHRWATWVEMDARLEVGDSVDDFFDYASSASTEDADRCLLALAMLAAPDGGDDVAAAAVLAMALLPGAVIMASRLTCLLARRRWYPTGTAQRGLVSERVDERVAAQLWIEVRSFPWRRLTRVGGNILMNTRARVLWECEDRRQLERFERTWALTAPVGDWATGGAAEDPWLEATVGTGGDSDHDGSAHEMLMDVLAWACETKVISPEDRSLLLFLVEAAGTTEIRSTSRGRGNLCSDKLTAVVAPRLGVSPATVRRRVARSLEALAAAAPIGFARGI